MSKLLSDYNKNGEINSNVAQTRLYSDLNLNLSINPITLDVNPITDIEAVKNSIKNLILTNFHDRPFRPTLGSGVAGLLFENASIFTAIEIKNAIEKVIGRHEPRARAITVQVIDKSDENAYNVTIGFEVFYDSTRREFDFFLTRLR
jgi:phage baseplate assembly protein W